MDADRPPHRSTSNNSTTTTTTTTGTNTSELFICFSSRLSSSSSMKISSKSILSPGRARDSSQISLSTSLSRRLRSSGSIKGGQASPMFPSTNGKKRGCSFENPEPSSPKVTCIGQVRVKTKKQGRKMRARSKSRREASFRKTEQGGSINSRSAKSHNLDASHYQDIGHMGHQFQQQECLPHRNQRWVHLPVTICEALRAFGAEFNCFLPCKSSCMANNDHREKADKGSTGSNGNANGSASSCGAVFARWLVAEKMELVVGEEEREQEEDDMPRRSQRRHVFEDIVIEGEKFEQKNEILEEEGRVSICIPPKNALLLMRCRSDPVKMAALANRFWECPPPQDEAGDENEEEVQLEESQQDNKQMEVEQKQEASCEKLFFSHEAIEEHKLPDVEAEAEAEAEKEEELVLDRAGEEHVSQQINEVQEGELHNQLQQEEKQVLNQPALEQETVPIDSSTEPISDPENEVDVATFVQENEGVFEDKLEPAENVEKTEAFDVIEDCSSEVSLQPEEESLELKQEQDVKLAEELTEEKEKIGKKEEQEEEATRERSEPVHPEPEPEPSQESKESESKKQQNLLPDCLLLMMCEPKLSMEVSKETWVCSTDFIRWQPSEKKPPPQKVNKTDGRDEPKRVSIDSKPAPHHRLLMQPPRSSCSFPAAPPVPPALGAPSVKTMNTMIEQKLVGAKPSYALTRCKSEPRKSSAKLAPDTCFWKNRKIEPHRPATLGVGAAGVGF